MNRGPLIGLALLVLVSCGGTSANESQRSQPVAQRSLAQPSATHRPAARISLASAVAMTTTPQALLAACRGNSLLRVICPRRVPVSLDRHIERLGFCYDQKGNDLLLGGHYRRLATSRCVQAGWGFEAAAVLPGQVGPFRASGWAGHRWVTLPGESLLFSPPLHVHVEIAASLSSPANLGPVASSDDAHQSVMHCSTQPTCELFRWGGCAGTDSTASSCLPRRFRLAASGAGT